MILLICTVQGKPYHNESSDYGIERIEPDQNSGVFFEHLGSAKIYSDYFQLVTYMNVSFYEKKLELIEHFKDKTKSLCQNHTLFQIDMISCHKTMEFLDIEIPSVKQKQTNLFTLLNHRRSKRGIFNGGGTFLKWILGVADSDDVDRIDDAIHHAEEHDAGVLDLMKEQIHVIRTTIGNFNDSIGSLKVHEETLNHNIDQINDFLVKDGQYKLEKDLSIKLLSYLNAITYLVNELNEQLDVLLDAILFAKSNVIHPKIISPHQFIIELSKRIRSLENGKVFPLPLEPNYAYKILELSKISCSYSKERLIFIIKTPICDSTLFNLYRSLSLPVLIPNSKSYTYIEPTFPFILLSQNKMQYKPIENLKECIDVTSEDFLCKSHTIHSTLEHPICETTLLTSLVKVIPASCKTTNLQGNVYLWHELKFNQWIYSLSENDRLTIICDHHTYDEPIEGTGILTLNNGCIGFNKLNKLIPTNKITAEYVNIIPTIPIMIDCCEETSNNSMPAFHLNEINLSGIRLDELRHTTHQLNKFEKDLDHIRNQNYHYVKHSNYFFLILKIIIGIIVITIIMKILQCTGCFTLIAACCKCFDFTKSCSKGNGCCVAIYNQCTNANIEPPIQQQPRFQLHPVRLSDLQRSSTPSLDDIPISANETPNRRLATRSDDKQRQQRKKRPSYNGYSLDD